MKFSIEDLESLAVWLDKSASVAHAKAAEFASHSDRLNTNLQLDRETRFTHFANTCREAATRLRVRSKRNGFTPPTLDEVIALAKAVGWPTADAEEWFDHFQSNGWKVAGKTVMQDWRAAARNGFRRWQKNNKARVSEQQSKLDPPRWNTFLRRNELAPCAYDSALAHIKEEFQKWLKANP